MQTEQLTSGMFVARTFDVARQKALTLLGWGIVAIFICLPCAMVLTRLLNLTNVGSGESLDPVSIWGNLTPLEKFGCLFSSWFLTMGMLGLTQAISTLAAWDACTQARTTFRSLAARLSPKLHRILALQLFVMLMLIILLPLSVFAIPAILIDNCGVFGGFGKSLKMWSHHGGKTILILLLTLIMAIGWRVAVGVIVTQETHSFLLAALALEVKLSMFYLPGVLVGIPTTVLYCQGLQPLQPPAPQ